MTDSDLQSTVFILYPATTTCAERIFQLSFIHHKDSVPDYCSTQTLQTRI